MSIYKTVKKKGKISFEYKDLDQLNKIIDIKLNYILNLNVQLQNQILYLLSC